MNKKTIVLGMGTVIILLIGIIVGITINNSKGKAQVVEQPKVEVATQVAETRVPAKEVFTKEHVQNMNNMCDKLDDEIQQLFLVADKMQGGEIKTRQQLLDEYTRIDNDIRNLANNDFQNIRKSDNETRDGGIDLAILMAKQLDTSIIKIKAAVNKDDIDMKEYGNQYDFIASTRDNVTKMKDALSKAQ